MEGLMEALLCGSAVVHGLASSHLHLLAVALLQLFLPEPQQRVPVQHAVSFSWKGLRPTPAAPRRTTLPAVRLHPAPPPHAPSAVPRRSRGSPRNLPGGLDGGRTSRTSCRNVRTWRHDGNRRQQETFHNPPETQRACGVVMETRMMG